MFIINKQKLEKANILLFEHLLKEGEYNGCVQGTSYNLIIKMEATIISLRFKNDWIIELFLTVFLIYLY